MDGDLDFVKERLAEVGEKSVYEVYTYVVQKNSFKTTHLVNGLGRRLIYYPSGLSSPRSMLT